MINYLKSILENKLLFVKYIWNKVKDDGKTNITKILQKYYKILNLRKKDTKKLKVC